MSLYKFQSRSMFCHALCAPNPKLTANVSLPESYPFRSEIARLYKKSRTLAPLALDSCSSRFANVGGIHTWKYTFAQLFSKEAKRKAPDQVRYFCSIKDTAHHNIHAFTVHIVFAVHAPRHLAWSRLPHETLPLPRCRTTRKIAKDVVVPPTHADGGHREIGRLDQRPRPAAQWDGRRPRGHGLHPGDHVIVSNGQVYHHAIYIGKLEGHSCPCFADMGREDKQRAPRLRIVEFPVFMRGYTAYYIVSYDGWLPARYPNWSTRTM